MLCFCNRRQPCATTFGQLYPKIRGVAAYPSRYNRHGRSRNQTRAFHKQYVLLLQTDALELNIFLLPTRAEQTSAEIEKHYLDTISSVTDVVGIPVSVKLPKKFTNVLNIASETYKRKAKGIVMFNRFIEPDIDVDNLKVFDSDRLSSNAELRSTIRSVAMCAPQVSGIDIAVSTGVHTGEDLVKVLLAGAKAAEICTAVYKHGAAVIEEMKMYLASWMNTHGFDAVDQFVGLLSNKSSEDYNEFYQRAQYMKTFQQ